MSRSTSGVAARTSGTRTLAADASSTGVVVTGGGDPPGDPDPPAEVPPGPDPPWSPGGPGLDVVPGRLDRFAGFLSAEVLEMAATWKDTTKRITLYLAPGQTGVPASFNRCQEHPTPSTAAATRPARPSSSAT